jgi:hypothetical protein
MRIVPGVYNALAYIQNPNAAVEVRSLSYIFKLYDDKGLLVAQKKGRTFIPAGQRFAVFEGGIQAGERVPARTTFEFTAEPSWRPGAILAKIRTLSSSLEEGAAPKAQARIKNESVDQSFSDIDVFIVLYDKDDNRVAFSKTVVDKLAPGETKDVYFTWPEAFLRPVVRTEVLFVAEPLK